LYRECNSNNISQNQISTSGTVGHGIYQDWNSVDNNVSENKINISGQQAFGIYLDNCRFNRLTKNVLNISGFEGEGITLDRASQNNIVQNNIFTAGSNGFGLHIYDLANYNRIFDTTIITTGMGGFGIYIINSKDNHIENSSVTTTGINPHGIYVEDYDTIVTNTTIAADPTGFDFFCTDTGTITAINCSFETLQMDYLNGGALYVKNYLDIQVFESDGITPIADADVEILENDDPVYATIGYNGYNPTTDANGRIDNIIVMYQRYYYTNNPDVFSITIKVKKVEELNWEEIRYSIKMNTSRTEVFIMSTSIIPEAVLGLDVYRIFGTNNLNITWWPALNTYKYRVLSNKSGVWKLEYTVLHPRTWVLDSNLEEGFWYWYGIQPANKLNQYPDVVEYVGFYLQDIYPPATPTGLTLESIPETDSLNISWEQNNDDTITYDLWWINPAVDAWEHLTNISNPTTEYSFSDPSLIDGHIYYFKIRAWDKVVLSSPFSAPVEVIHYDRVAPKPPEDLNADTESESEITLSWQRSPDLDVEGYIILINLTDSGSGGPYVQLVKVSGLSYKFTELIENTLYYFVIRAYDEANNTSPDSQEVSAKTSKIVIQPRIISTSPKQNSKGIPISINVTIQFSISMDKTTMEKVLVISPLMNFTLNWEDNATKLTIDFLYDLKYSTEYSIVIGAAKSTSGGVLLGAPYFLSFTTIKSGDGTSPETKLDITSHSEESIVTSSSIITVTGSSIGIPAYALVTVTLGSNMALGTIAQNGTWAVTIRAPQQEGIYSLKVLAGNQSYLTNITVKEETIKEPSQANDYNLLIIGIGLLIIILVLIFIGIYFVLRKKRTKEVLAIPMQDGTVDEYVAPADYKKEPSEEKEDNFTEE
jgi:hypothetical protein